MDNQHMNHENMDMEMDHSDMGGHMMMHGGHMMDMGDLRKKFWISLVLAIPIFILSSFMGMDLPFQIQFPGSDWIVLILASILFFYGGKPFFQGAKGELKSKQPAMMTLITMGIGVAYIYSIYSFIMKNFFNSTDSMDFFWELASLIVIMLLGHWIEMKSTMEAGSAMDKIVALVPDNAHVVHDGMTMDSPVSSVKKNTIIEVRAGETIPLDGVVTKGNTYVNESLITGESESVKKTVGDKVVGGSINGDSTINLTVEKTTSEGYLSQISKLVSDAQMNQSRTQKLADKVSGWLFYAAITAGLISFVVWLFLGTFDNALLRLVTVLIIACPHALGLAVPLVISRSTSIAATNGLIIRDNQVMEISRKIDYLALDKTGTLTEGDFSVNEVKAIGSSYSTDEILALISGLEVSSNHPIAKSIVEYAAEKNITPTQISNVKALKGYGLSGELDKKSILLVNRKYLQENKLEVENIATDSTVSYLVVDSSVVGYITLGDSLKANSKEFISKLKARNIIPIMLTGDNKEAAKKVADELGIDEYRAELLPQDKDKIIKDLELEGHKVMMVGDGINDAPSLAAASIGVAIGAGTDVAIESADVILYSNDPINILDFFDLSAKTYRKTVENLWWGAGYNIIAIPLAAGVLAGVGIVLSPAVGAILMSLSTVVVALNALTLRK
ncbi:copper-translocating P-type ATPase [Companilactobacillus metriopterae]|uniref:copper-translocating P-type ATPase n=1 Tax=Companilactobacillus metriopterae TaxID=1909267 RepID=UPI00100AD67E|nr:copper-translocating P-type ATPase [Companilactobacillus metriopterae]